MMTDKDPIGDPPPPDEGEDTSTTSQPGDPPPPDETEFENVVAPGDPPPPDEEVGDPPPPDITPK